jgi:hypothetical protein|tara:strand:- start:116 stop:502 length:387 start_codon:yes stop_codon:yes gene_type:complete
MGKKAAHSGESPKDRSVNLMDKFITRNERRTKHLDRLPARRKDPNVPFNLWPLKDQIEYMENRTDAERFDENYPAYSYWIEAVQNKSKVYPRTFTDWTLKLKPELKQLYNKKTSVRDAVEYLRKQGVY